MSDYRFSTPIQMRYSDFDMLGHLNNAAYITYFETARIEYYKTIGWDLKEIGSAVAHIDIDFLIPVLAFDKIQCHVKTTSLGNTSFKMDYEITSNNGNTIHCKSSTVMVYIDKTTGKANKIPTRVRELFSKYEEL
ncbi:MAG: thioesterase family protein [Bacteroidota bacterium]